MYNIFVISNYIINRCDKLNKIVNNAKLQKILYFIQAEFLVATNYPCFEEDFEAWSFGPVIPKVYMRYRGYGGAYIPSIKNKYQDFDFSITEQIILNNVIDKCSSYSSLELTNLTKHQTPWKQAYIPKGHSIITKQSIKNFFEEGAN